MNSKENKKKVDRLAFLGTLAGGLAHEVKNPLSTMSVNLQLLKEDWEDAESPKELKTLKRVDILMREIKRLESIVNNFLKFARGFSLEPELTSLNDLVTELIDFVAPEASRMQVRISQYLSPGLPKIMIDGSYVQKALLNLVHNAFQALDSVEDGPKEVFVKTRKAEGGVELEITDTGPGIPSEYHEKIYQVFFSTKKGGTGMGLPTVRRIVEEHDGTLSMVSDVGKGTSFILFFPEPHPESSG